MSSNTDSRKIIAQNTVILLTANIITNLIGAVRQLYIARVLTPTEFGVWNLVTILISYSNYADLGANTGLLYKAPRLLGQGRDKEAKNITEQIYLATWVILGGSSLFIFVVSFLPIELIEKYAWAIRLLSSGIIIFAFVNFYNVEARIRDDFLSLSIATIIGAVVSIALTVIFSFTIEENRVVAFAIAWLLGIGVGAVIIGIRFRIPVSLPLDWKLLWNVIRLGFPLSIIPIVFTLFQSIDRWLLAVIAQPEELGYFALGAVMGLFLCMIPNTLGVVMSARLIKSLGIKNNSIYSTKIVVYSLWVSVYIMTIVTGGIVLCMPFILHYLLPSYMSGLYVLEILVVANCLLFPLPIATNFLLASHKMKALLLFNVSAILIEIFLILICYNLWGIQGAAWAVFVSDVILAIAILTLTMLLLNQSLIQSFLSVFNYYWPIILGVFVPVILINHQIEGNLMNDIFQLLISSLKYLLYLLPVLVVSMWTNGIFKKFITKKERI